ncbi:RidA family protein [Deinococcus sp.]|uniref:RidA family protein n=1 Tax=Deinococcus sp. TaxID=47478 RepID=UPI0025C2525C|nr:RidA family protein [Deinococcus sp.]
MKKILALSLLTTASLAAAITPYQHVTYLPAEGYAFSESVKVGTTIYLAGQIGNDASGEHLVPGGVGPQTTQALEHIEAVLKKSGYTRSNLVKCTVLLKDIKDFAAMNEAYKAWMVKPYPARATFATAGLVMDAAVEIDCIAAK